MFVRACRYEPNFWVCPQTVLVGYANKADLQSLACIKRRGYAFPGLGKNVADSHPGTIFLHRKEKWVLNVGKSFNKQVYRGQSDLNIQAHTKRIAYRKIPIIEGTALFYLIDH